MTNVRLGLAAGIALLAAACQEKVGPASQIEPHFVFGGPTSVSIRGTVRDAGFHTVRPEGAVLRYTLYEGRLEANEIVCEARTELTKAAFESKGPEWDFDVTASFDHPCPMPAGDIRYGIFSLQVPNGPSVRNTSTSYVPTALGGDGFSDPAKYDDAKARVAKSAASNRAREELLDKLGALSELDETKAPPLDKRCDARASVPWQRVLRVDRRLFEPIARARKTKTKLGSLDPAYEETTKAVNEDRAQAIASYILGDEKKLDVIDEMAAAPVEIVEAVKVARSKRPSINDREPGKPQTYEPGVFEGEVWIIELASKTVLCRARVLAINTRDVEAKRSAIGYELQKHYDDEVGSRVNRAAREAAPWLPNTWPNTP